MNKKNLTEKQLNKKLDEQHKKMMAKFKQMRERGARRAAKQDEVRATTGRRVLNKHLDAWDLAGFCDMGCGM